MQADTVCPTCEGSGVCVACRGGSTLEPGFTCECEATHNCVDCHGLGTYTAYATEQMNRLRTVLQRNGFPV